MRTGGCSVQQALTAEAAAVVKQAVSLARRRGHAQVTPLHVASTMLSAAGVLRGACLQSHSHPLQCKALELCFNVALNRLPTCAPSAALFHQGHHAPALSNALVAAFKRAQAHQRRGSVESQQQPVLTVRVELEQLIVSILDDPSVSRVMREAGFSSAQVKANVEKAMSLDQPNTATSTTGPNSNHTKLKESKAKTDDDAVRVLDVMAARRKRCVVVVGECSATAEGMVRVVMDKVSKGELQPQHECLKNLQFVPLSVASFQHVSREEVDAKARELRALVRGGCAAGKGVVLVLEDLGYASEAWAATSERRRVGFRREHGHYCPVEHAVMEVSSLVCSGSAGDGGSQERFWLLGYGTYPVYMKCRSSQPSLEAVWGLHPIIVPDGGLALSLSSDGEAQVTQARTRTVRSLFAAAAGESELTCCGETVAAANPGLPPWLQRYQDPDYSIRSASYDTSKLQDLCNKWTSKCNASAQGSSTNHTSELTLNFSSTATSPASSSISTYTHRYTNLSSKPWHFSFEPRQPWPDHRHEDIVADTHEFVHASSNPDTNSASNSSDGNTEAAHHRRPKFMELTAENLKIMCDALERRVARHKDIVPDIASVVLQCRSGMGRRSRMRRENPSPETWLLFQGRDRDGKAAVARELARLMFGSCTKFTSIALTEFSPVHSDSSTSEFTLKRQRSPDNVQRHIERLYDAIRENPHRVVMIDGIEELKYGSEIGIKNAIATGRVKGCNGDEIGLEDAIIVLSCESFNSRSRSCSPRVKQRVSSNDSEEEEVDGEKEVRRRFSLDLNACAEDVQAEEDRLLDDPGILNVVDGVFFFRLTENI